MSKGILRIYYGEGRGKSEAALGSVISQIGSGKNAAVLFFDKEKWISYERVLQKLEPELKLFYYEDQRNGFQYGKKVIVTGAYGLVVLDGLFGLVENGVVSEEELGKLIEGIPEDMVVICTGERVPACVMECANEVYRVESELKTLR